MMDKLKTTSRISKNNLLTAARLEYAFSIFTVAPFLLRRMMLDHMRMEICSAEIGASSYEYLRLKIHVSDLHVYKTA